MESETITDVSELLEINDSLLSPTLVQSSRFSPLTNPEPFGGSTTNSQRFERKPQHFRQQRNVTKEDYSGYSYLIKFGREIKFILFKMTN